MKDSDRLAVERLLGALCWPQDGDLHKALATAARITGLSVSFADYLGARARAADGLAAAFRLAERAARGEDPRALAEAWPAILRGTA